MDVIVNINGDGILEMLSPFKKLSLEHRLSFFEPERHCPS